MGKTSPPLTALEAADYLIARVDHEAGDNITNLKLQKLLYSAQGFHVAMCDGQPLFSESILAWKHGPVVRQVYSRYNCQWHPIDPKSAFRVEGYAPEDRELLDAVYTTYGQFSAEKLERMTHEEPPWMDTPANMVISLELLMDYFSPLVHAGRRGRAIESRPLWPTNSFRFQRRNELSNRMASHRSRLKNMARCGPIDVD